MVGLRKQDLDLKKRSIQVRPHKGRSLKNEQSIREIPLLPLAYEALKAQANSVQGELLFPRYATLDSCNADSASAALNKWAKKFVPEKSMHCFRHSMRDLLRAVMCPESISKEIGGWSSSHDVSVQYGQGYPLNVKLEQLEKAYAGIHISNIS